MKNPHLLERPLGTRWSAKNRFSGEKAIDEKLTARRSDQGLAVGGSPTSAIKTAVQRGRKDDPETPGETLKQGTDF